MVKIIAGLMGTSVATGSTKIATPQSLQSILAVLRQNGVQEVDTARVYNAGKSEEDLGAIPEASQHFKIGTKAPGFSPGSLTYQKIIDACNASLSALKQDKIDLYYFHGPDRRTPLEESCKAINDLHKAGKVVRFGVSNFNRSEVEEVHAICKANGWLLPSVYQGGYNPLARTAETELFPSLRKLGISFSAYSPLAGGFFSRPAKELRNPPPGSRMDQMQVFSKIYVNDLTLELHESLTSVCADANVELKEATLRWLMHHSILGKEDGIILGASSEDQMKENLQACERGPLPESVVAAFENLWTRYSSGGMPAYCV